MRKNGGLFMQELRQFVKKFDKKLLIVSLALCACGLTAIISAVLADSSKARCIPIQIAGILLGVFAMIIIAGIDYEYLCELSVFIAIISCAVLLFTAIFAEEKLGNKNWLSLGPVNIQPSEFTKTAFIITISTHISKIGEGLNRPINILKIGIHFLLYFVPVVLQKDIGSALIYIVIFVFIIYAAGVQYRYFIGGAAVVAAAIPVIWNYLQPYQQKRIIYGFQPELDPLDYGYQPLVARMALGSGQMTGLGLGNGIQTQNALLPANHTDFVFAIIGEEFGFIGCVVVIALLVILVSFILLNMAKIKNVAGRLICVGVSGIIISQSLINLGMVLGLSPVIGVTLPFVSYGGSSALSLFIALGVVESVREKELTDKTLKFSKNKI